MIVILIQAAERRRPLDTLQLAVSRTVFPADAAWQGQTAVGPQLPLGTETVRCLDKGNQ